MRVLICGSRTWADEAAIQRALEDLSPGPATIIHGGARGADQLAGRIAARLGYAVKVYEADWSRGKRAGPERNLRMLDSKPDLVLAFWDGQSRGTAHTIAEARRRNIPVGVARARARGRGSASTNTTWCDTGSPQRRPRSSYRSRSAILQARVPGRSAYVTQGRAGCSDLRHHR